MKDFKVAIIGCGAAGLMCGAILAKSGICATIFDGNEKPGKKLYITGKGRCNLTNLCEPKEFLESVVRGRKFMTSAIYKFSSADTVRLFEDAGLALKVERGKRVYPKSDRASDVTKTLVALNAKNKICLECDVKRVKPHGDKFCVEYNGKKEEFDAVVVATGGKSYSATGSRGFGYRLAQDFGHSVVELKPALTAIELGDKWTADVQGLPLKNVEILAHFRAPQGFVKEIGKLDGVSLAQKKDSSDVIAKVFGEALFTDIGITGPIILTLSSVINRGEDVRLFLDFKPALDEQTLDARLVRDFDANKNKNLAYIIKGLLPKNFVEIFLAAAGLVGSQKVNGVTKEERKKIVDTLKHFALKFKGLYPLESGVVTSGGVCVDGINPKSCESKRVKNLYFIGEVLDVDCLTGGFNLQTAFSTAFASASDIISKQEE